MKKHFMRWLSSLLLAALLLSGTALMEEAPAMEEAPVAEDISVTEEAPALEDDIEIAAEPEDIEVEETEAALEQEAEEVADVPGEEVVEEDEPLYAMEEADASEKLMEGSAAPLDPNEYIPLTAANFPDASFRKQLLMQRIERYVRDGVTYVGRSSITEMILGEEISDLKGIERLTNLQSLKILTPVNQMGTPCPFLGTKLDLSALTKLKILEIHYAPNMTTLLLNSKELTEVKLGYRYQDAIYGMPNLTSLSLGSSTKLKTLEISYAPNMTTLILGSNELTKLQLGSRVGETTIYGMPNLTRLSLGSSNKDVAIELYGLSAITAYDFSVFPNATWIYVEKCPVASLDVSNHPKLSGLSVRNCNLKSLNVSNCPVLKSLGLNTEKNLTKLDISTAPMLKAVMKKKYRRRGSGLDIYDNKNGAEVWIRSKVKIITKASSTASTVPAVPASFAEVAGKVPATVAVDPTSTAKNTKATALAAPGSAMQLNLGGATGKKFKSSKKKVATVNKNGVVTFKKGGKVKITYKVGKQTRKVTLTVIDPTMPKAVALNQTGTVAAKVGDAVTLTATMNEGAVSAIKWKTSNKKVATVKNGVVTFKKAGKVTITAVTKRGKKKAKVTYTVAKQ